MFISKVLLVNILTVLMFLISNVFIFSVFGVSEIFYKLVEGVFTTQIIFKIVISSIIMAIAASAIGSVALGIGFIKNSVPTTIISSVLIVSLLCNVVANSLMNISTFSIFAVTAMLFGAIAVAIMSNKVDKMENE